MFDFRIDEIKLLNYSGKSHCHFCQVCFTPFNFNEKIIFMRFNGIKRYHLKCITKELDDLTKSINSIKEFIIKNSNEIVAETI